MLLIQCFPCGHQVWWTSCPRLLPSSRPHDRTPVPAKAEPITRALTGAAPQNAAADVPGSQVKQNQWNLNSFWISMRAAPAALMTGSRCKDLIEGNHDLQRDQRYDNQFETQGSLRVDDVSERCCGLGDYRKFSVKRVDALL